MSSNSVPLKNRLSYVLPVAVPLLAFVIAVSLGNLLIIDYIHVLIGAVWIGTDLFLGLLFASVTKTIDDLSKAHIAERMMPMTLFFIPTASIITPLLGYILSVKEGIFSFTSELFIIIIALTFLIVVISFAFIVPYSYDILKATRWESKNFGMISKRINRISLFALVQLAFQIALVSLMAYIVVFL